MRGRRKRLIDQLPPVLRAGEWIQIGHDSAIRLSGRSLLHRCNGVTQRHGLSWLVHDKPLLNWMLHRENFIVDRACQPA
jgi:hypothetical protein